MDFEGQRDQLDTLCGEMESCGIEDFHTFVVGKWLSICCITGDIWLQPHLVS